MRSPPTSTTGSPPNAPSAANPSSPSEEDVRGDLIGFVAATYARGIPLVQIPTTLLAQIDSSIGGKVAVDLPAGKNLVGAFYPAHRVIIDPDALATLPREQLIADYAEVIKTAVIFDADLFNLIEASTHRLDDPALLAQLVERCVRWKAKVVDEDPEDRGIRAILNYGHTIAHAIETTAGYGAYRHGEAVAIGMVGAGRLAQQSGHWSKTDLTRQNNLLAAIGLPATYSGVQPSQVLDAMLRDKKVQNGIIRWVLPTTIGHATVNVQLVTQPSSPPSSTVSPHLFRRGGVSDPPTVFRSCGPRRRPSFPV